MGTFISYSGKKASSGINSIIPLKTGNIASSQIVSASSLSGATTFSDRQFYYPFIPKNDFKGSGLICNVVSGSAGTFLKIGLYADNGGLPGSLLFESTSIEATGGLKTATYKFDYISGTTYWLSFIASSTVPSFSQFTPAQMISINAQSTATFSVHPNFIWESHSFSSGLSNPFPATIYYQSNIVPYVGIVVQ